MFRGNSMNNLQILSAVILVVTAHALSGCANQDATNRPPEKSANANTQIETQKSILIYAYLGLDHPNFFFQAADGTRFKDELQTFNALEAVYTDIK